VDCWGAGAGVRLLRLDDVGIAGLDTADLLRQLVDVPAYVRALTKHDTSKRTDYRRRRWDEHARTAPFATRRQFSGLYSPTPFPSPSSSLLGRRVHVNATPRHPIPSRSSRTTQPAAHATTASRRLGRTGARLRLRLRLRRRRQDKGSKQGCAPVGRWGGLGWLVGMGI
jgi:hypothetical protein